MNNICLAGLARSGKNTFASMLRKHFPDMEEYALAEPIKEVVSTLFGWDYQHKEGSLKETTITYSITPDSLQNAGEVYWEYGIDKFAQFHDCWDALIPLLGIKFNKATQYYDCTISPRRAFQLFGTDWGRSVCPTLWLDLAPKSNSIITDVRFENEAKYFKALGAKVILIKRSGAEKVANHVSEQGLPDSFADVIVHNDSTKLELEKSVEHLLKHGSLVNYTS